ncbi:hypothetical protein [Streptomyces sp. TS71-3]|uniref:hypothetical protein n=1 Tax=Streptomyces sp. TS71-3 TaxID=2733862 RepID=UPI001B11A7DF|nr:hypothetical protein [Streptomyces sp. TS71-3]GHJ35446.1 hypothetical protein Sm713_10550 [Streptomyces sp. TS71-3]
MDDRTRTVNAVQLRQSDALNWITFQTVICRDEWVEFGFGEFGQPVTFSGVLMAVENGQTLSRSWSRVWVSQWAPATGKSIDITSVLGGHCTVTITELED